MHIPPENLKNLIIDSGIITQKDYEEVVEESERTNSPITDVIVAKGLMPQNYLTNLLSNYFNTPMANLETLTIPKEMLEIIPEEVATSKKVIAFDRDGDILKVAMIDPGDLATIEFLSKKTGLIIRPFITSQSELKSAIKEYKRGITTEFKKIIDENTAKAARTGHDAIEMAKDLPIISILDTIIIYAAANNASDIHIEPTEDKMFVRYRIDGIMRDIVDLPLIIHSAITARVKILANLQIDEHRVPQDGRFKFKTEEEDIAIRVSIMPIFHGEKIVMRLLIGAKRFLNFENLGISGNNLKIIDESIKKTYGLILSTGPTGSGKTTTLYTMMHALNQPGVNIVTIEDPIEYDIPRISQTQVNVKTGLTFVEGLRSFLRQNPDIIMVGEIRDAETVDLAINAALTGHLVLSTLHTNDAPSAIPRLLDLGAENFLLSSTLTTIIAQRLVRKNCANCVSSIKTDTVTNNLIEQQLKSVNQIRDKNFKPISYSFKGRGCNICGGSGYRGQIGIFEVMEINPEIRELITKKSSTEEIKKTAIKSGMITLFEDGIEKVQAGHTTLEEVLRVIRE